MCLVRNGVGKSRDFRGKCGGFLCVLVSTSAEKLQFSGGGGSWFFEELGESRTPAE
jgi:hypothetical protein